MGSMQKGRGGKGRRYASSRLYRTERIALADKCRRLRHLLTVTGTIAARLHPPEWDAEVFAAPPHTTGSPHLEKTLQTIASLAVEMLHASLCLVLSFREESPTLWGIAASGRDGLPLNAAVTLSPGSLAARAIASGSPAWVRSGVDPPRLASPALTACAAVQAGVAAPILEETRVIGVILAYHEYEQNYTDEEVLVLTALAAQAGSALRNATHYEQQRELVETMQRALTPQLPASVGAMEFGCAYLPRQDRVGGDFYDFIAFGDGRFGILIGDVSGSGLRAAMHTAMGRYMLRAFAYECNSPAAVLGKLNEAICTQSQSDLFFTLFYGVLHPSGVLVYANGAHPYPILHRAGGSVLEQLDTTGTVVGILPEQRYQERQVLLHPGDTLLLYTDGITEATGRREYFGMERLCTAVRHWRGEHPQELVDSLVSTIRAFTAGQTQDDIALFALKLREQD